MLYKKCHFDCNKGGQIVFGGEDTDNCDKVVNWIDVNSDNGNWEFVADSISIGNITLFNVTISADTGSQGLTAPPEVIDYIKEKLFMDE
ncbi:unnamed protein product [Bursaphelenchus okinawaensis]|uniref:Peptidase A1 domain-containing protein n=1 Tax=Bursaphelenchus okinawaensis TaxID=465554 RepID=A0A811KNU3_9BILA|nr:unnamed protein product [Bursaphelenchus okinawaensis]CAG9106101.1 unnamed protein product [Bursaphelenchus okinawaensis]